MAINLPKSRVNIIIAISAVLLVVIGGVAVFLFKQNMDLRNNPDAANQEKTARLVEKVGKLYALPTDEEPTLAEVSDKEKLKEQPFFKNVENGDFILIYPNAKTAILYREAENKLINVGPIAIESAQGETEGQQPADQQNQDQAQ